MIEILLLSTGLMATVLSPKAADLWSTSKAIVVPKPAVKLSWKYPYDGTNAWQNPPPRSNIVFNVWTTTNFTMTNVYSVYDTNGVFVRNGTNSFEVARGWIRIYTTNGLDAVIPMTNTQAFFFTTASNIVTHQEQPPPKL